MYKNIKFNYARINKHDDYLKQLFYYNTRKMNIMTMNDLLLYNEIKKSRQIKNNLNMKIIIVFKSRELFIFN